MARSTSSGIEHVAQHRGLIGRRTPLAAFARAKAEARPIDEDDAVARGEMFAERQMHVLEIGAGAVQNHDRRRARRGGARSHFDHVLRETADIDETAARPMQPLDQQRADQRDETASAQHRNDNNKRGHGAIVGNDYVKTVTALSPARFRARRRRASACRGHKAARAPGPRCPACRASPCSRSCSADKRGDDSLPESF